MVFLVVVCKSRNGMHFTLLKSDNICSFYTNLNIEKYAVVLAGKPIITDIWKIGHLLFHSSDRKKICTSTLFSYYELYVLTFSIPCCDVRYEFRVKMMFGSFLIPLFYSCYLFTCTDVQTHLHFRRCSFRLTVT